MNKSTNKLLLVVTLLFCCFAILAAPQNNSELTSLANYPRIEHFEQGDVTVDFPSIESWQDFRFLQAWIPVEVQLSGEQKSQVGSVHVRAVTDIDFEARTVSISGTHVLESRFSDIENSQLVAALASRAFADVSRTVPLDVLLRLLPEDFQVPDQHTGITELNFDPPVIVVSETPLQLLSIDKEPVRARIEATSLEFVVNTNWNVFFSSLDERWYVLNDGVWQTNNYLSDGGWTITDKLPADFARLAANDEWREVQESLPARLPETPPTPFMISLQMTELIQLDGSPRLTAIGTTGIFYVRNTDSDLFKFEGRWYYLVSGRWFSNNNLTGPWQSAKNLPAAFSRIPADHKKGHVLFSVAGTRQAKLSLIEAAIPHRTSVVKGSAANLKVTWVGKPRFESIETTRLQRGLNTPYQVIGHNNFYYLCYEGAWYFSASAEGPWQVALQIPDEIYRIPATDPAYNVTFVRLDENQGAADEVVNYSYSSGYTGSFSTTVTVVHGTGWYYPSSVFWGPGHLPSYWHHMPTYGYNMGYNPVYASYGGRYGYQPWGGYTTIMLESPSVDFTHAYGSAWEGPLQTTPGDPSDTADRSLDEFLPAKESDGSEEFIKTSKAAVNSKASLSASSLYASSTLSSNMFSGPNGEVYKRDNNEWQQYNDGSWSTAERRKRGYELHNRPVQQEQQYATGFIPAHKKTLSRGELDRQELARTEGMDNYAKYRMEKDRQ